MKTGTQFTSEFRRMSFDPVEAVKILYPDVTTRTGVNRLKDIRAALVYVRRMVDEMITAKGGTVIDAKPARRDNPLTCGLDRRNRSHGQRVTPGVKIGATVPTA